jgi:hypothetical protein
MIIDGKKRKKSIFRLNKQQRQLVKKEKKRKKFSRATFSRFLQVCLGR